LLPVGEGFGEQLLKKIMHCASITEVVEVGEELGYEGYAMDEVLNALNRSVMGMQIDERKKGMMLELLSKADESLVMGATEMPIIEVLTSIFYVSNLEV
jgi:DNA polymerase III delta prime subunit